jgi:hypothetical protein
MAVAQRTDGVWIERQWRNICHRHYAAISKNCLTDPDAEDRAMPRIDRF